MHSIQPIAIVSSPYKEKFAVPRQPGLVKNAFGKIEFLPNFAEPSMFDSLSQYSHLWLIFQFHHTAEQGWSNKVRPPRLGGNDKIGVFASRSPFRPNALGLSVVKLDSINLEDRPLSLSISELDLVDQTPVYDIKPYLPYADSIKHATSGLAQDAQTHCLQTVFSEQAMHIIKEFAIQAPHLEAFIREVLEQDPRPAYHKQQEREYGMRLEVFNIRWRVKKQINYVTQIEVIERK